MNRGVPLVQVSQKSGLCLLFFFFIQVSSWSAWGSCSAPPGRCSRNSGTRKRTRRVTLSPSCGGSSCPTLTHTSQCTPVPIPCKVILIIFFLFLHICCLLRYVQKCTHWHLIWTLTTFWISPALWRYFVIFAKIKSPLSLGPLLASNLIRQPSGDLSPFCQPGHKCACLSKCFFYICHNFWHESLRGSF